MNKYVYTFANTTRTHDGYPSSRLYIWRLPEESGAPVVYEGQQARRHYRHLYETQKPQEVLAALFTGESDA